MHHPEIIAEIRSFRYRNGAGPALKNIRLTVHRGEFLIVLGPAGAGKTTLCHCLTGAIPHFQPGTLDGDVCVGGRNTKDMRLPEIAGQVGFLTEDPQNQLFSVTVEEDLAFGPGNLRLPQAEIRQRIPQALRLVGLEGFAPRRPETLSGGEAQRAALAAVLVMEPPVLVLDRPAAQLDPVGRQEVYASIHRLNKERGTTVILVEDRLEDLLPYATRIILLQDGEMAMDAPPRQFFIHRDVLRWGLRIPAVVRLFHENRTVFGGMRDIPLSLQEARNWGLTTGPAGQGGNRPAGEKAPAGNLWQPPGLPAPLEPPTSPAPVIVFKDLSYCYPGGMPALDQITLTVTRGEFVAVAGANGAGKTTLLKHLNGLLRPVRGQVTVMGRETRRLSVTELSRHVGFLWQNPDLQIFCGTVFEEVAFGLKIRSTPPEDLRHRVYEVLDYLGLSGLALLHPYRLNRGQRQMVALASVLVSRPDILAVDEPATCLGPVETETLMQLLCRFQKEGGTVVMVTHDLETAVHYATRLWVMHRQKVAVDVPLPLLPCAEQQLLQAGLVLPDCFYLASYTEGTEEEVL